MRYEPIETGYASIAELTPGGVNRIDASTRVKRSEQLTRERVLPACNRSRSPGTDRPCPMPWMKATAGDAHGLARVTLDAARVSWPAAECRGVALVCCTPEDLHAGGLLPRGARATIAAMVAVLVNGALPGAVVTCTARTIDDAATISVEASRFGASILHVSRELRALSVSPRAIPEQPGLRLDLWRAGKLAALIGGHMSFVPRANGAIAFELSLPTR